MGGYSDFDLMAVDGARGVSVYDGRYLFPSQNIVMLVRAELELQILGNWDKSF